MSNEFDLLSSSSSPSSSSSSSSLLPLIFSFLFLVVVVVVVVGIVVVIIVKLFLVPAVKAYRGVDTQLRSFLTSALDIGEWPKSSPCHFTPGKNLATYCIGGWTDHRASLVGLNKRTISCPYRVSNPLVVLLLVEILC